MARKPAVSVYIRIRNSATGKQQLCPAVWQQKNKKLKAGFCLVGGQEEEHPEGTYNLRYAVNGVSRWETLEGVADDVVRIRMERREQLAHPKGVLAKYVRNGITVRPQTPAEPTPEHYGLADEIKTYLGNVEKLAPRTYTNYKLTLSQFQESCGKIFVHQITKQDLQAFDSFLLKRGDEDRTRANKIQHLVTFLRNKEGRRAGPPIEGVSIKVKYVEAPPEAYTRQELEELFRVSSEDDKMLWRFFLGTGFRESEVSVAEYTDVNPDTSQICADEKPYFDFRPKDCEKRLVPISDELIIQLKARKNGCSLIFHKNGRPDGHLLRRLKIVA
ncbi:MAG: phage integrase SAM-like domain-containing protein [Terriglobales bacterium]